MKFTELVKRVERNLKNKINGDGKRIKKAQDHFIPGLEYSLKILKAVENYYNVIVDDEQLAAKVTFNETNQILRDKISGADINKIITDERVDGIKLALRIFNTQKKYYMLQLNRDKK